GATGETGATGVTGPTGSPGGSAIIPFASGLPVALASTVAEDLGTVGLIGFGSAGPSVTTSTTINLTGGLGLGLDYAFSMPEAGTIIAISAFFSVVTAVILPLSPLPAADVTVIAELYSSPTP